MDDGDLADWQIRVLMQRYARPATKTDRDKKGDKKAGSSSNTQSKASANQRIFYFPMIEAFGNRHNGTLWATMPFLPIAERFLKCMRLTTEKQPGHH